MQRNVANLKYLLPHGTTKLVEVAAVMECVIYATTKRTNSILKKLNVLKKTYQKVTLANQILGVHQTYAAALGVKIPVPIFIVATVLSNMTATDVVQMECGKIDLFILILFISIGIIKSCIICFHILTTFFYLFCQSILK